MPEIRLKILKSLWRSSKQMDRLKVISVRLPLFISCNIAPSLSVIVKNLAPKLII